MTANVFRSSNGRWYWQHPLTYLTVGPFPTSRMAWKDARANLAKEAA